MTRRKFLIKYIAENAIIAALYFVMTIAMMNYSYQGMQFRIAEILVLLCFWRPDLVFGVTLGCFLGNIMSTLGPWDMLFGTLATLISSLLIAYASPRLWVAIFYPVIINGLVVGAELYYLLQAPFWLNVGLVAGGEITVIGVGYVIWVILIRNRGVKTALEPTRHQDILY
jgi:uncharacterized membrane protein